MSTGRVVIEPRKKFEIFAAVRLGTGLNNPDFASLLAKNGFYLGDWVEDILEWNIFRLAQKEIVLNLVAPCIGEFGFDKKVPIQEVYTVAKEFGLGLCPMETVPQLCLQYPQESRYKKVIVATENLMTSDRYSYLLHIISDEKDKGLYGIHNHPGRDFGPEVRLVFQDTRSNHKA